MADNVSITAGSGTSIASDDIGGVQHQRIKLTLGADGVSDGDVSSTNPMPVTGTFYQATQPVSAASLPLPTGAATSAKQDTGNTSLSNIDTKLTDGTQKAIASGDVAAGAADSGNPVKVGGKYNATMPTLTDGQRGDIQLTTRGAVKTTLYANDSSTTIASLADNADATAISATANKIAVLNRNTVYNGSTWDRMYGDATNGVDVDVTRVVPGTGATNLGKAEDAAHTSGDTGVFALGVRNDAMATLTSNDGDYNPIATSKSGRLLVTPAPSDTYVFGNASVAGTGDTSVVAAAGVGLKNYITNISVANTGSSATLITLKDGNAGSTLWYTIAPAGGGSNIDLEVPIVTSSNTALYFACGTSSTTVYVSASGYKAP